MVDRSLSSSISRRGRRKFWRTCSRPLWPSCWASSLSLRSFSIAVASFVIQVLLGGTRFKTVVYLIYQQILVLADWQFAAAICVILLVVTSVTVAIALRIGGDRTPLIA